MNNFIVLNGQKLYVDYVPINIVEDLDMTSNEKIIFEILYSKYHKYVSSKDKLNYCSIDIDSLASESNSTYNRTSQYLDELANDGWINLSSYGSSRFILGVNDKKCLEAELNSNNDN